MDVDSHLGYPAEFYDFNTEQKIELYKVLRILCFSKHERFDCLSLFNYTSVFYQIGQEKLYLTCQLQVLCEFRSYRLLHRLTGDKLVLCLHWKNI